MDEIGRGLQALAALGPLGIALGVILLMAAGSLASLGIAWKRGYFRSHTDIAREQRGIVRSVEALRRDFERLEQDARTMEGRIDVLAVDQAGLKPIVVDMQHLMGEARRTMQRLGNELARLGGVTSTLQAMTQGQTPPDGSARPLGQLDETPDPDRGKR